MKEKAKTRKLVSPEAYFFYIHVNTRNSLTPNLDNWFNKDCFDWKVISRASERGRFGPLSMSWLFYHL